MENKDLIMLLILIICIAIILRVLNTKEKVQYTPKLIDTNIYDNRKLYEEYYEQFGTHVHNSTPILYRTVTYIKPKRHRRYYRNHR